MLKYDVVIVGGGILAYSTAFSILSNDSSVKLLIISGKTDIGNATLASGAMLGCYGEITKYSLSHHAGKIKHSMAKEAKNIWPLWIDKIKKQITGINHTPQNLEINPGTFIILNNKGGDFEKDNFSAIVRALEEDKEPYLEINPSEIPGFHPRNDSQTARSIYLPNEGTIDSHLLLSNLKKAVYSSKNCTVMNEDVVKILSTTYKLDCVETNEGNKIRAKNFVFAAGAYTQYLINEIPHLNEHIVPIFAGVGLSLLIEQGNPNIIAAIRTPNRSGSCGLHVLPKGNNSLYVGATNTLHFTSQHNPKVEHLAFLLQSAVEQINHSLSYSDILSYSVGNRAVTLDSFPLVGKSPLDNLWILSGSYREGLHLSPILSEIITSDILNSQPSAMISSQIFSPMRAPIQTMTQEEAINDAVKQYMLSSYEYGMKIPQAVNVNILEKSLYTTVENIYNNLNIEIAILPELIFLLSNQVLPAPLKKYFTSIKR
jgi:glycine/D-amino acid oxidase-like deaminating enzyme